MEIVYRKLSEIKPNPKNPRKSTKEAVESLAKSIAGNPEFFEARPILLSDRTGEFVIIGGERRSEAARLLGMETVPTILMPGLSEAQEDEIMIKDNTHAGIWDEQKLAAWGKEQLEEWNVDGVQWSKAETEPEDDNYLMPETETEPRCRRGQVWTLGRHRLMCGDSTNREDVDKLTGGQRMDLALTDPPYGIDIVRHKVKEGEEPGTGKTMHGPRTGNFAKTFGKVVGEGLRMLESTVYHKIKGDETTETARLSYEIMKDICTNLIIFGGNYFSEFLPPRACWLVWDKVNGESVFADVELAWTSYDKGAKLYKWMWNGMARAGDRKTEGVKRIHPTQKPVGLFASILKDFSVEGDKVIDLFAGSGPLAIAAEQTGRTAYMMEYEPYYCDIIIDRWEQYTGKRAELLTESDNTE